MQETYITPITGDIPRDFYKEGSKVNYIDENKSDYLNKILRGEISAVEAYEQVIPKFTDEGDRFRLSGIRNEHSRNVEKLRALIENTRFAPDEDSGVWGTFVSTLMSSASIISNTAILNALIGGEEHGLTLYRNTADFSLSVEEKKIIFDDIIPSLNRHVASLENMVTEQSDSVPS